MSAALLLGCAGETPLDGDGDGYGEDGGAICAPEEGYAVAGGDCDDADPTVNPAAPEICDDGQDQDCDGLTDESALAPPCAPIAMETTVVGGVDLVYDADCVAWIAVAQGEAGLLVGTEPAGADLTFDVGDELTAVALDPRSGAVIVATVGAALGALDVDLVEETFGAAYVGAPRRWGGRTRSSTGRRPPSRWTARGRSGSRASPRRRRWGRCRRTTGWPRGTRWGSEP